MTEKHKIAALQLGSAVSGTSATLEKVLSFESDIKASGCELLVMPEALFGGYPKGAAFGTRVGYRVDAGREEFLHYWQQAIDLDGEEVTQLCELAKRCQTSIVTGVIERDGATLYCTAIFVSADGELVAKHRKLMPTASERLIWGQGDGSTLSTVDTKVGTVGAVICWENYMPLMRTAMYAKGLDIWCTPTVDDREIWQSSMRHIAYEGRLFLVSACQYLPQPLRGFEQDADWPEGKPLIRGGSVIISPMGEILAGPLYDQEGLICAEVDLRDIIKARYDFDPTGHYSRPDVFQLHVDEREKPATDSNHKAL
jgi:nitrilase